MSYVEQDVFTLLTADAALVALVGPRPWLWPLVMPEGATLPAMVYQKISSPRVHSHSGQSGLAHPRIQFTCWARSYPEVKQMAELARLAFARGMPRAILDDDRDKYEADTELYGVDIDVRLWHQEATE